MYSISHGGCVHVCVHVWCDVCRCCSMKEVQEMRTRGLKSSEANPCYPD